MWRLRYGASRSKRHGQRQNTPVAARRLSHPILSLLCFPTLYCTVLSYSVLHVHHGMLCCDMLPMHRYGTWNSQTKKGMRADPSANVAGALGTDVVRPLSGVSCSHVCYFLMMYGMMRGMMAVISPPTRNNTHDAAVQAPRA